jgi:membrane-bound lytic murein transglycosylase D
LTFIGTIYLALSTALSTGPEAVRSVGPTQPVDSLAAVATETIENARTDYRAAWALRQSGEFRQAAETAEGSLDQIDDLLASYIDAASRRELAYLRARLVGIRDASKRDAELELAARAAGNEPDKTSLDAPAIHGIEAQMNPDVEKWVTYYTGPGRKTFERWWKRSGRYMDFFQDVLRSEGVPPDLVHLVFVESGFSMTARSRAAAVGPWQFLRSTGRLFGLTINEDIDERRDPGKSTVAAARYLKHLYAIFQDWPLALASYNAGEGRLLRSIKYQGTTNYWDLDLPRQTEDYVPQFMAVLEIGRNPEKYGFDQVERDPPMLFDEVTLQGAVDLNAMAQLAECTVTELRELNPGIRRNGARGRDNFIAIRVPPGTGAMVAAKIEEGQNLPNQSVSAVHRVQKGETLSAIATRYGVSANVIALENGIGRKTHLQIGQSLSIPRKSAPPSLAALDEDDPRASTAYVPMKDIRRPAELNLRGASEAEGRFTVRVGRGETLGEIAERYGVTVDDIKDWNRLSSGRVRRGTRLKIRTGPEAAMQLSAADSASLAKVRLGRTYSGSIRTRHRVGSGETLGMIAQQYGTSVSKIQAANGLRSSRIYAGQSLKIPGTPQVSQAVSSDGTIVVRSGDTLGSIAKRHGTTVSAIKAANGLSTSTIHAGQRLRIPG